MRTEKCAYSEEGKAVLVLNKLSTMPRRRLLGWISVFLTSAQLELSIQLHAPTALPPRKEPLGTSFIGGWVVPTAGLDNIGKWTFLPLPGLELRHLCRPVGLHMCVKFRTIHTYIRDTLQPSGWSTRQHAGRSLVWDPMRWMDFFNLTNPSRRTRPWDLLSL
jgi:hypothetical protein